jgi:hypothetical protein
MDTNTLLIIILLSFLLLAAAGTVADAGSNIWSQSKILSR